MRNWLKLRVENLPYLAIEVNSIYEYYFGKGFLNLFCRNKINKRP